MKEIENGFIGRLDEIGKMSQLIHFLYNGRKSGIQVLRLEANKYQVTHGNYICKKLDGFEFDFIIENGLEIREVIDNRFRSNNEPKEMLALKQDSLSPFYVLFVR